MQASRTTHEHDRGPLRYGSSSNVRTSCSDSWCSEGVVLGSQVAGRGGTCHKAVRESVMSARRGTIDVSSQNSVEEIRCKVKRVGAL